MSLLDPVRSSPTRSSDRARQTHAGCQLSIPVHEHSNELLGKLEAAGVKCGGTGFRITDLNRKLPIELRRESLFYATNQPFDGERFDQVFHVMAGKKIVNLWICGEACNEDEAIC